MTAMAQASPDISESVPEYATWYEVIHSNAPTIKPVRVLRETNYQIVLADCAPCNARRSKADTYFRTWDDAHRHLLACADLELAQARWALAQAQARLGNVKGMKPNAKNQGDSGSFIAGGSPGLPG